MQDITHWYNGYRFHMQAAERSYNSDMGVVHQEIYDYKRCTYPKRMLDMNIALRLRQNSRPVQHW
ncbi:MAG: hypothetical protein R3E95_11005 [Thiolinea sp.]